MNLPTLQLLAIHAVGFKMSDFVVNLDRHAQLYRELGQVGRSHQVMSLRHADGNLIECEVETQITPHCPQWAVFRLIPNPELRYLHQSNR
ncbi:MAG: hypothetical protein HC769_03515 [Cyanobacteria bacterium CRU_2_1]|nr:hypothetical protein [Cyanobacteria bacterium CRU_2_1]